MWRASAFCGGIEAAGLEGEASGGVVMANDESFWLAIPKEAIDLITEDDPVLGTFLANIALLLSRPPADPPPKQWVRERFRKAKEPA